MKRIPLTKGQVALVSDKDYTRVVVAGPWHVTERSKGSGQFYAAHSCQIGRGKVRVNTSIRMHRLILDAGFKQGVDHINGNGLDNRRSNLRLSTQSQNLSWKHMQSNNNSGFIGVSFHRQTNKWHAYVNKDGERRNLGLYVNPEEAALVRDGAAMILHGEFARLNFPDEAKRDQI